jgi:hypothetical protein
VGLADVFATSGPYEDLLLHLGLSTEAVVGAAHRAIERKDP